VSTTIYFAASRGDVALSVRVEEPPDAVFKAWNTAAQQPFQLTQSSTDGKVWVNPVTVAYWEETPPPSTAQFGS
jgi:hypothetical protein